MPTIAGHHRVRWGPRNHMTVADRRRLVDCTTWSRDSAGTDRSLLLCALAGISWSARASVGEEVLVLDERAELTPREIADEKLAVALHTSRHEPRRVTGLFLGILRTLPQVLKDCEFRDGPQTGVFARQSFGIRSVKGDSHAE
jgi:hypothetical protein